MSRVTGNWTDSRARDVPAPAGEIEIEVEDGADEGERQVMGKFWAHDPDSMMEMDRQALQEALNGDSEVGRLEKLRDSDYEKFMRDGGADRLIKLSLGRR